MKQYRIDRRIEEQKCIHLLERFCFILQVLSELYHRALDVCMCLKETKIYRLPYSLKTYFFFVQKCFRT